MGVYTVRLWRNLVDTYDHVEAESPDAAVEKAKDGLEPTASEVRDIESYDVWLVGDGSGQA